MVCLALVISVVVLNSVYGRPPSPPLPMKGGCYHVDMEMELFRVEGEAIILGFPQFDRVLKVRNILPPTASYVITRGNGTEAMTYKGEGRIQQRNKQLWFLPSQASDSGEYICTYRNETYCVAGSVTLHVYASSSLDVNKVSYPISATVGENLTFSCPSLRNFNKTDNLIDWYKESSPAALQLGREGSFHQGQGNLQIPAVKRSHAGVYICQLVVLINDRQYKVSRIIVLHVSGPDPGTTTDEPNHSVTSDQGLIGSSYSTVRSAVKQPPVIISPLNGTIFESPYGSGLELFCTVLTECQTADSTMVTWLVNDQSVEASYLERRVLQERRKVTKVSNGCQIELGLALERITAEDMKAKLKCVTHNQEGRQEVVVQLRLEDPTFTWLVVATVAASCFLTVISVFLYVLFKPKGKKKMDYILARQNSVF